MMSDSVERWLQTCLCAQYAGIFEAYGYRTLQSVCQLQLPNLLAMGVPRIHCEKILENVNNLRQTMFGHIHKRGDSSLHHFNKHSPSLNPAVWALKTVAMNANYRGMNPYPDDYSGYGQGGNNMQGMGYHQGSYDNANMSMMNPMGGAGGGGYPVSGYDASQSHMMMASQGQMSAHTAMYQQQTQQAYMAQQQQQQQQYYSNSGGSSSGSQYTGQAYPMQAGGNMQNMAGNNQFYNAAGSQGHGNTASKMVPPPHHHMRNTSGQQNPQQVADNILQMASSYPSHHTVQVPLKNRHAPYQIPRSPQNFYPEKGGSQQQGVGGLSQQQTMSNPQAVGGQQAMSAGQIPAQASQPQGQMAQAAGMGQVGAVMYSGSSPHSQMPPRSSPMMASPIAGHQTQGLSSPSAMHSPSSATVCSPVPSSPGLVNMRSPCSVPMRSPAHLPSGYPGQAISSPPQKPFAATDSSTAQHCSPTSMHSPASHSSSPYTPAGMAHHVSSPPQSHMYSGPSHSPYKMDMLMDSGQGPGGQGGQGSRAQGTDPLQSLQKLVMLPETQVVDPKSVVSDGCLQNCDEGSKNSEGPAEQSWEAGGCSAGVSIVSSNPPTSEEPSAASTSQQITSVECASSDSEATIHSQSTVASSCVVDGRASKTTPNTATDTISTEATAGSASCMSPGGLQSSDLGKGDQTFPLLPSLQSSPCKADKGASSMTSADTQSVSSKTESHPPVPKANSDVTEVTAAGSCDNEDKDAGCSTMPNRSFVQCNGVTSPSSKENNSELSELVGSAACSVSEDPEVAPLVKTDPASSSQEKSGKCSPKNTIDTTKTALKPSQPKKRHSERLAQSIRVGSSAASVTTSTCKNDAEKDSAENTSHLSQTANATGSTNLVNGFGETYVNGTEDCDAGKNNLGKKNHVHTNTADKGEITLGVSLTQKAPETKLVKKRKSRALAFSGRPSLVAVNGSGGGGLLTSSLEDVESSGSEAEVPGGAEGLAPVCGIGSTNHPASDNEEDRFASGLDLGYDSPPPCETLGDDGWKQDVEKHLSSNGVDEADGTCVEDNCDKGEDLNNKGSKNSNSTKSTPSPSSRVVTRSSTGRAPKRKVDDAYMTTAKRTRRNSGATSKPNETMSLSMECEEIDTKDSFSEVEVISSSDEANSTYKDKKAENKAVKSTSQKFDEQSCKKRPIVVLTKPVGQNSKIEQGTATNDQKPGRVSPKPSRQNSTQYYCIRGEKGRFISREEAGTNFPTTTIKVDSDSDDEPLILVQRRSSREEDGSAKVDSSVPVKSELEKRMVSCETNTEEIADFKMSFSIPTQSSSTLQGRPGPSGITSPAGSECSTPRKRGRPRKSEQSPIQNHKKTKKGAKANKKKKIAFSRPDSADDSFKDMKLSKTLNHLKCKKKGDNSQSGGPFSPFVRMQRKTELPCKVSVFNHPPADTKDLKSINKKKSSSATAAPTVTVQITNFSSDKTVMLPSTNTTEYPWVCALCGKRSSYRFLGDLFGPYYLESHLPASSKSEGGKKESKLVPGSSSEVQNTHNTRRRSLGFRRTSSVDEPVSIPQEVWVHEDCAMWSSGVYLVDSRLYGLEEALRATMTTVCACCKEKGAMIGCLHKGCNQNFHYMCAVDKMCFLDVENFSMLCPKHKDKRLKGTTASTSKS